MAWRRFFSGGGKYGPFWHQLNKGGLQNIIESGELRSTQARVVAGGGEAVRAHRDDPGAGTTTNPVIKFYTDEAPRTGTPPWLAEWPRPEGETINITIDSVDPPDAAK